MQVKHSFSRQHFRTAKYFSQACADIETSSRDVPESSWSKHRAYVTGTILFAVAAIEASVNELFLEAKDNDKNKLAGLSDASISCLAQVWDCVERLRVVDKYQKALSVVGAKEFDRGHPPFQDVSSVVKLRNALVHYKPEWDHKAKVHRELESTLTGKFQLNPFGSPGSLWFPHRCLGAGCAEWAVATVDGFMSEFCRRMGIPARL